MRLPWKRLFLTSNSPHKLIVSFLGPDQPIDSPDTTPIFEILVLDLFHEESYTLFKSRSLSSRHGPFNTCNRRGTSHLSPGAGPHVDAKPLVYRTCWYGLRAAASCRLLMKTVGVLGACDCEGKVMCSMLKLFLEGYLIGVCSLVTSMQVLDS